MAGCFLDGCGIKTETVGSPRQYQISAKLSPNGGLECEADGINVNLLNEVSADTTRPCANLLHKNAMGELYAQLPNAPLTAVSSSNLKSIPNNGTSSGTSQTTVVTNTTECAALLLIRGQFQINFEIADTVNGTIPPPNVAAGNFSALFQSSLKINGSNVDVQYDTVGGTKVAAGDTRQYMKIWHDICYMQAMAPGQAVTITDECVHEQTRNAAGVRFNVSANIATSPPDFSTGYRTVITAVVLPIGTF